MYKLHLFFQEKTENGVALQVYGHTLNVISSVILIIISEISINMALILATQDCIGDISHHIDGFLDE